MRQVCSRDICTGCSLCAEVCPVGCISMREGKLGHLFPNISTERCIDCGKCVASCPALKPADSVWKGERPSGAYAAWAKDTEDYRSSASGGAASVLARNFISGGGSVFGCTSVSDGETPWPGVRHIRVVTLDDTALLKGSKYIQSSLSGVFPQLRKDLSDGRKVLFIGTPCQVAAVKALFGIVPDNLYLVDIVCHGVPSEAMFRKYVKHYLHIRPEHIAGVNFRPEGKFRMDIYGRDCRASEAAGRLLYTHRPVSALRTENLYYSLFMDAFIYRESCYRCRYACSRRISDMTLGDFWGLPDGLPEHGYGVSLALPVTAKGRELLSVLQEDMYFHERPLQEALDGNEQLRHPKHKSVRMRIFRILARVAGLWVYYPVVADWLFLRRLSAGFDVRLFRKKK